MIVRGVRGLSLQRIVHTNKCWIANFYFASSLHGPNGELNKLKNTSRLLVGSNEQEPSSTTTERYCYEFCQGYSKLPSGEVRDFLLHLAPSCRIDKQLVLEAASTILKQNSDAKFDKLQKSLQSVLTPPINKIFSKIGQTRGGIKFLIDLRKDVLTQMKTLDPTSQEHKDLQELSQCLKNLLSVWISVGFMNIRRVTWDSASSLLEKISVYEAVHPLRGWTDLKNRLGPYRRVFVYTHPSMSEEPLVVLHVALTKEVWEKT
ncbi:malonyl-CoA decarboxylase, mitochondrial isoform X1 [Eurytemora carolleeae]|uniref:malonyl-CoA decarboxylase, mitochondrial isoform X1 n=1 Tax=Eurytemora carolleeae TaxID=1294199 RepID=UPI000C782603|nr:malonyl-CoA decarboxylase, mitochondrial isoform X1 [Eurytemora carolleeae]|eukprot:XP_023336442.1 malonyl-CoA decarboxylase, mitochondrial-like isoform X1 [Eurytemora affinis]